MPPLLGGSKETHQVYSSFAKLYKILRMSNSAFFSGDLDLAHHIGNDALQLFGKIGDEKAIAIAANNMGNTLFALTMERRSPGTCVELNGECCVKTAIGYYEAAIVAAKRDFERVETDAEKSMFAQQLADRHFNRAMFLLHLSDDPCAPENAKEIAFHDLLLARQYDQGVKEYMLHSKTLYKNSDVIFERSIRRLHGLALLTKIDPDVWQVWDIYDLVDQGDLMLQAAWNRDDAPIFRAINKVGRLQQLEGAAALVEYSDGKLKEAAVLSTRMLVEDEYLMETAFVDAAEIILKHARETEETEKWSTLSIASLRQEFRKMRKSVKKASLDIGSCYVFCVELCGQWNGTDLLHRVQEECRTFYEDICQESDSFGMVTFNAQHGVVYTMKPTAREDDEDHHRQAIQVATTGVASSKFSPTLPVAVDMVLNVSTSSASDVFLIYISDGRSWDPESFEPLVEKIQKASSHRKSSIDVIAIGVEIEDSEFSESCERICSATRSRNSKFLSATEDSLEHAFGECISAAKIFDRNRIQQGLTMEKF